MDERKKELKQEKKHLKRAYRREKCRYVLFWKLLSLTALAVVVLFGTAWVWMELFDGRAVALSGNLSGTVLQDCVEVLNRANPMEQEFFLANPNRSSLCLWTAGIAALVLVCAVAMWIRGGQRLRMTEAALSYRDFKQERREEKKAEKEQENE